MATRADFEAAIEARPEQADPYLVYADWLNQQGDPRGELILLDYRIDAGRRGDDPLKLRETRDALLATHEATFIGALRGPQTVGLHWRFGFIHEAYFTWTRQRRASEFLPFLTTVLGHPSLRFVETLSIEGPLPNFNDWRERLDLVPDTLRSLRLSTTPFGREPLDARGLGWVGHRFPRLERLAVVAGPIGLDCESWPNLRDLELVGDIDGTLLAQLHEFDFSALERLNLTMEAYVVRTDLLGRLCDTLQGGRFPALRHLLLRSHPFDNARLVPSIARAPFAPRLETLDLTDTELTDAAVRALFASRGVFRSLITLDVDEDGLSRRGRKQLEKLRWELMPEAEALIRLARHGDTRRVEMWLERHGGKVPVEPGLFHAADFDRVGVLDLLLDAGADPQAVDEGWQSTALGRAAMNGSREAVVRLLDAGTNEDAADRFGYTPLLRAAAAGHARIARRLLDAGADPHARNQDGNNAGLLAAGAGHADVIRVFLEEKVDLDRGDGERTPLDEARIQSRQRVVDLLTEAGAHSGITREGYPLNWNPKTGRSE